MRIAKKWLPLLIVAAGVGVFVLLTFTAAPPEPLRPVNTAPVVSVQAAVTTSASPTVRIFGRVEAPTSSTLTAGVEADVIRVDALEGERVGRGRELIVLDSTDAMLDKMERRAELAEIDALLESERIQLANDEAALETETALLALAHKAVERAAQLARTQAGSEAALDQALQDESRQRLAVIQRQRAIDDHPARARQLQARRERAQAALQRAERAERRTRINAPFAGRITEVSAAVGDRVSRGDRLLSLYDDSQLELRAQAPTAHIPALRRALADGMPIVARAVTADARPLELRLHRLSAQVADGQGGIDAFFRVPAGDSDSDGGGNAQLPAPGATLEVTLALPPIDNVLLLPPDALYGRERIYLVRDNALHSRHVRRLGQLSRRIDGRAQRLLIVDGEGFTHGDEILNSRLPQAIDGLPVRVAR